MRSVIACFDRIRVSWSLECLAGFLGASAFLVLVFSPPAALMVEAGQSLLAGKGAWLALAVPTGRRLGLLAGSLGLAAGVAVTGMALGLLVASVFWHWQKGVKGWLRWSVLVLAPIPPYVHAMTWSAAFSRLSALINGSEWPGALPEGWMVSAWVQVMALLPLAVGLALAGLDSVDVNLIEVGRTMHSDVHLLCRIVLPLALPALAAGSGFLFLLSLTDYSVPSLFGVNVYALEIFAEYSASNESVNAFGLALPLLLVAVAVVTVSQAGLRNAAQTHSWRHRAWANQPEWPGWLVGLQRMALSLLMLQAGVLLWNLIGATGSWDNWISAVASAGREIAYTFWLSVGAALLCLPAALAVGNELVRSDWRGRVWWLLVTLPLAIPAPLVGIGLISVWNRALWPDLYGSAFMPVLAGLARFAPLAVLALLPQLRRVDTLLLDAARVIQANPLQTWLQVRLPMLAPGLLAAACVAFALTTGELGATLIVAPPGRSTVTMRIYNYLHYGASSSVAGLCLTMAIGSLIAGSLALMALAGWSRLLPDTGGREE